MVVALITRESYIFTVAERERQQFSASLEGMRHASSHVISRENVYQDVMDLYSSSASTIIKEPLRVTFEGEMALDAGGVCRDMFSAFWEAACNEELFSGSNHIIPAVHPQVEMSKFGVMGTILSHGYLTCGFLPSRLPLPIVILALLGPNTAVDDGILLKAFLDYVVSYEQEELMAVFQDIRCTSVLSSANRDRLVSILSHFNCTRMPTVDNIKKLLLDIARNEFCVKPAGALHAIHAGVPIPHIHFWKSHSVQWLHSLYVALNATPTKVLKMIQEPRNHDPSKMRVYRFLTQFICTMHENELSNFLRFTTGSSVCSANPLYLSWNGTTGVLRVPISHSCSRTLELSTTYSTYEQFAEEFGNVLKNEYAWIMDIL